LHLAPGEPRSASLGTAATVRFDVPDGGASFTYRVPDDMELVGPMKLRLQVELVDATDANLFVAVSKFERSADGSRVAERGSRFEGPFGFGCDVVARGWLRLAHRRVDDARSEPRRPFHPCDRAEPMRPGEVASVDVEVLPSATAFARGDVLRLDVQGRWFWTRSMLLGMFPCSYAPSPRAKVVLHLGGDGSYLLVPQV